MLFLHFFCFFAVYSKKRFIFEVSIRRNKLNYINMELQRLLNKLEKVEFNNSHNSKKINGLLGTNEVEVTLNTELSNNLTDIKTMPIQIVLLVKVNGAVVMNWGAETNEDNSKIVEFFVKKQAQAVTKEMRLKDSERKIAKIIFDTM